MHKNIGGRPGWGKVLAWIVLIRRLRLVPNDSWGLDATLAWFFCYNFAQGGMRRANTNPAY